ncbi:MAG: GNAT family N-acetyltransferase [Patescibacteria group bacterium]
MRIFHKEFGYRYDSYEFGYTTYAKLEKKDQLKDVYAAGFLPHSADPKIHDQFYMARSVRVPLQQFSLTSENRRIEKKFVDHFTTEILSYEELKKDAEFLPCFLSYFEARHGERVMSKERALGILATTLPLRAIKYRDGDVVAGYVLEIIGDGFSHYWYSCYQPTYAGSSFGMWMMLDALHRGKNEGRDYAYLGTAYGDKGKYKTNFSPLQFWDGDIWNNDLSELKRRIKTV